MIADATPFVMVQAMSSGQLVGVVVALMVIGLMLLGAEVFVIPGFGVAGVLGVVALGGGVTIAWANWGGMAGTLLLFASLTGTVIFAFLFFKSRAGNRLMLGDTLENTSAVSDDDKRLIGQRGVAVTMLRPSGAAEFGEERLEVETDGDFVPEGQPVVVVAVEMGRVVVELAPPEDASPDAGDNAETTDD